MEAGVSRVDIRSSAAEEAMRWLGSARATRTSHSTVPGRALSLDLGWGWPGRRLGYDVSGPQGRCPPDVSYLQQPLNLGYFSHAGSVFLPPYDKAPKQPSLSLLIFLLLSVY